MVATRGKRRRRRRDEGDRNGVHQRDRERERDRDRNRGRHPKDDNPDDDNEHEGDSAGGGRAIVTRVRERASGALHSVLDGAHSVTRQIRDTTADVTGAVLDTVLDEAERIYRKQKKPAMSRIAGLSKMADRTAHALHAVKADGVAEYVEQAGEQIGSVTDYLEDRTLSEILDDAGRIVQRNRAVAMGGMFVVGFAVARFLKATESRDGGDEEDRGDAGSDDDAEGEREREGTSRKRKRRRR